MRSVLVTESDDLFVSVEPVNCNSHADVLGLIEAARIAVRCRFIQHQGLTVCVQKEAADGQSS